MFPKLWTMLALFLLAAGCVPAAKYNELESMYDAQQDTIKRLRAQRDALAKKHLEFLHELQADFKPLVDKGILKVEITRGRVTIGMAADVLFPSGSAALSPSGEENIREVAQILARRPDYEFQVEGHTDDDPIATAEIPSNWYLGAYRSLHVVEHMIHHGMPPGRISAASFSQYHPVANNNTDGGKTLNRRIEIVLLPDLSDLPGYKDIADEDAPGPRKRGKKGKGGKGGK